MTSGLASPRGLLTTVTAVATFMGVLFLPAGLLSADSSELFFTEYVEGTGTNQAVEIYNPNDMAISLSASRYMLAFYLDGGSAIGSGVPLVGTVQPGSVFVVTSANADAALLARANQHFGTDWFDGNDAVALIHGGATVDVIGQIGFDPGSAWGSGGVTTADHTLRRKAGVTSGDADGLNGARGVVNAEEQVAITRQAYELLGAGDELYHHIFAGQHQWSGVKALPWLATHLGQAD